LEKKALAMSTLGKPSLRDESSLRFQRILAAVDGSEGSAKASEVAADLALKFDAQLFILNVFRGYPEYMTMFPSAPSPSGEVIRAYEEYARKTALEVVDRAVSLAEKKGVKVKLKTSETIGSVVETITDYAVAEKVDLIVMGTRGMGGFKKMLLGSVSSGVVTHAQCAVLVVR
jgi:nucleotide-binding universal stress UspA family protein